MVANNLNDKYFMKKIIFSLSLVIVSVFFFSGSNAEASYWSIPQNTMSAPFNYPYYYTGNYNYNYSNQNYYPNQYPNQGYGYPNYYNQSGIQVETIDAESVEDEYAVLRGVLTFNNTNFARVWFEYGDDEDYLDYETQRVLVNKTYTPVILNMEVEDLDKDQEYFYRIIAEDQNGRISTGEIVEFFTDDNGDSDDETPDVETEDVSNIDYNSAEIEGSVDMNEFENGLVFFIYGQDEDLLDEVQDEYDTYSDIDEEGDDLQKVEVDDGLDDNDSYQEEITGLEEDTEYFYAMCVQYEDEDGDDVLQCGDIESFDTDSE